MLLFRVLLTKPIFDNPITTKRMLQEVLDQLQNPDSIPTMAIYVHDKRVSMTLRLVNRHPQKENIGLGSKRAFNLIHKVANHTNQYIIKSNHDSQEKKPRSRNTCLQIYKVKSDTLYDLFFIHSLPTFRK